MNNKEPKPLAVYIKEDCSGNAAEAARRIGVDYITLHRWTHGKQKPGRPWVLLMAQMGVKP